MEITACPKCGSTRIFQGRLKEGVLTGFFDNYVCRDCGYHGSPIIFDDVENYKNFLKELEQNKEIYYKKDDMKSVQTTSLSDKEKKCVTDFLKENEEDYKYIDKKFMKNTAMSLGFVLFVTGILVIFLSFYHTILLLLAGVALFVIGFFGPSEEDLKKRKYRKKLEILPRIAGVILVINALVNGFLYSFMLLSFVFVDVNQFYLIGLFIVELVFCLFLFVTGVFALLRRRWGFAVLGSILGLFLLPVFYVPNIISFVGLVLIVFSRFVFKK